MNYRIYKLKFKNGVHFGNGTLDESAVTFQADVLFSALYIEAIKQNCEKKFYQIVKSGDLRFSDAFPYFENTYTVPKPILYVEHNIQTEQEDRKKFKNMTYIPVEWLEKWLSGALNYVEDPMKNLGKKDQYIKAAVRGQEDTQLYHVGIYRFNAQNGLYIIAGYNKADDLQLLENLLSAVSYTGIGGKKGSGLGRFAWEEAKKGTDFLMKYLNQESEIKMLLSGAFPQEKELDQSLEGASYLLNKRSGYVASEFYAEEYRRKRDLYVFAAGSCFKNEFEGDIYDVTNGGSHPVYRYAKPLFMGVPR